MTAIKVWWGGLSAREQQLLGLGGLAVAAFLLYLLVWAPLAEQQQRLQRRVSGLQEDLQWVAGAVRQLRALPVAGPQAGDGRSLLGVVDSSLRQLKLAEGVRRVQPEGEGRVRVWLEGIGFDALLGWLEVLQDSGIQVDSLAVDRRAEPGRVDGRVVLLRAGGGG